VRSAGATLHNGLYLHLPLPAGTPLIATDQHGNPVLPLVGERDLVSSRSPPKRARSPRPNMRSSTPCRKACADGDDAHPDPHVRDRNATPLAMDLAPFGLYISRASPSNNGKQL